MKLDFKRRSVEFLSEYILHDHMIHRCSWFVKFINLCPQLFRFDDFIDGQVSRFYFPIPSRTMILLHSTCTYLAATTHTGCHALYTEPNQAILHSHTLWLYKQHVGSDLARAPNKENQKLRQVTPIRLRCWNHVITTWGQEGSTWPKLFVSKAHDRNEHSRKALASDNQLIETNKIHFPLFKTEFLWGP